MSDMIKENMKETEAASTLLVQVIVLVLMGMFLSMHVLISFVWSGLLSAFLSVEWLPTAMHYLQSWEFARLSVGIPFVIMLFCCIHNYLNLKRSLPDQINPDVMQSIVGSDGRVVEFPNDHPLYVDVLKMSKKAGIRPPRLFACLNSRTVNAWTMPGKNGDNAVLVYSPLLDGMTRSDLRAVIGHELGHIMGSDVRRKILLGSVVQTLGCFYGRGLRFCFKDAGDVLHDHKGMPTFVAITTAILTFIVGIVVVCIGFLPWLWSKALLWWREYHDEYYADARGAWLTGDALGMAEALIVLHWIAVSSGRVTGFGLLQMVRSAIQEEEKDVHPPEKFRVRRWKPDFDGNWKAAYLDVMRRRGISR